MVLGIAYVKETALQQHVRPLRLKKPGNEKRTPKELLETDKGTGIRTQTARVNGQETDAKRCG